MEQSHTGHYEVCAKLLRYDICRKIIRQWNNFSYNTEITYFRECFGDNFYQITS